MLAGGFGKRLENVTGGNQPKCFVNLQHEYRAIDFIVEQLEKIGIDATWSADNYYHQYEKVLKNTSQKMLWQKPGGIVEAIKQPGGNILAIAPDCIFPFKDIPDMVEKHLPGTITWAATKHSFSGMDAYRGMDITPGGAIIGRKDQSIIRAPVTLIDTHLLKRFTKQSPIKGEGENLYFDVLARIEQENLERIKMGKTSILNAYMLTGPVIDFGTPTRFFELRDKFQEVKGEID